MSSPELSLIVATVGRVEPLERLFDSLARQTDTRFEVIVVDQNPDDRLVELVRGYTGKLALRHVRSARGLSRARNVGLALVQGSLVCFPDDDCWYDPEVVRRCLDFFARTPRASGLTGTSRDALGAQSGGRFDRHAGPVDRENVFRRGISYTIFCRTQAAREVLFDETLGLGAGTRWGSGEETDFILRCVANGYSFHYDPSFVVRHPQQEPPSPRAALQRGRSYGRGFLRVLKLHHYPRLFILQAALRPLAGATLALTRRRPDAALLSLGSALGRLSELRVR